MIPASRAEAQAMAKQAAEDADTAAEQARYAQDLADALDLQRLVLVRREWNPPSRTITYGRAIFGEVTNDCPDAVLGGWIARPATGEPTGPHPTARAAADSLIPPDMRPQRSLRASTT